MEAATGREFESWPEAGLYVLRCWGDELRALMNEKFPILMGSFFERVIIELRSRQFLVSMENAPETARSIEFAEEGPSVAELARAIKSLNGNKGVILLIPESEVLRVTMRVPLVRASLMKSALSYELERLSPIPFENLYADFVRGEIDPVTGTADYVARAVRRTVFDQAIRLCKNAGLDISEIHFKNDPRPADGQCFSLGHTVLLRNLWQRYSLALLVGLFLFVGGITLIAAYARQSSILAELDDQVIAQDQRSAVTDRLERQIALTNAEIASIAHAKDKPPFLTVLASLTRILPDGSWVTKLEDDGQKIHLQGYSDNATSLVALFDSSGQFQNAQFGAAVIRDASMHADRFDLTTDFVGTGR